MAKRKTQAEKDQEYMDAARAYEAAQEKERKRTSVYATTFCNQGHRLADGKPVEHECYILDPVVLENEIYNGPNAALEFAQKEGRRVHYGKVHSGLEQADVT
jgi:hypothetical protein